MIGRFMGVTFQVSHRRVRSFQDLTIEGAARYTEHEVIGGKPLTEYVGPELAGGSLSITLNAMHGVNPASAERSLRSCAKNGDISSFILGGRNLGRFIITEMSAAYDIVTNKGGVVQMTLDLGLREYN